VINFDNVSHPVSDKGLCINIGFTQFCIFRTFEYVSWGKSTESEM